MDADVLLADAVERLRGAGARFAFLHGSRANGTVRPESDVDVAAWWPDLAPHSFEVDLAHGVDLLVLNRAPLELAGRVAATGQLIFDDDPVARVRWLATTRKIYFDERPRLLRAHQEFLEVAAVVDEVRLLRLLRAITDRISVLRGEATQWRCSDGMASWFPY